MPPFPHQFSEALQVLRDYHRALMTRIAEEIVDNRDDFGLSYAGKAEEIIDRYGHHLQSLARLRADMMAVTTEASYEYLTSNEGEATGETAGDLPGQPVGPDTALEVGAPVLVNWAGHWWPGQVVALEPGGDVLIHYEGWAATHDEVVPRSRLRIDADDSPRPAPPDAMPWSQHASATLRRRRVGAGGGPTP